MFLHLKTPGIIKMPKILLWGAAYRVIKFLLPQLHCCYEAQLRRTLQRFVCNAAYSCKIITTS